MKSSTLILLKTLTWIACLWPLALLTYEAVTNTLGPDPTANIELTTGYTALLLLIISLGVTPVRSLSPRLNWLIKFRRLLGLFAFAYATVHLLTYIGLYAGFSVPTMISDIEKRRFITMGAAAWLLLLPLALTSTTWSIRKLGGRNWNRLHKLVYVAAICGIIHYWWQVKTGVLSPMRLTIVLAVLLLARVVMAAVKRRRMQTPSVQPERLIS
ncbi:MAG TPA: protein-methionine-sulfoxide reductase heme-binding subunit MsrQ [Terracidiphilus sp.]|nr:protein-methionine-sulfoxide reductase heme-binding subunit MsrQ [Terracidiphilus sp.]